MTSPAVPSMRLVLIHTVASLPATFGALCDELLPGVTVEHVVDESLLKDTLSAGHLTDDVRGRFANEAAIALATSPDLVVLTCSSVGPAADDVGVERIDTAMAERAVEMGARIGTGRHCADNARSHVRSHRARRAGDRQERYD